MAYVWQFGVIWRYKEVFLKAAVVTIELTILICIIGTILGLIIALLRRTENKWINIPLKIFIDIVRAVPPLVWLIWFYYCIPILFGIKLNSFSTAVVALSIAGAPFLAEIIRAGIESIPKGQYESAYTLGFSKMKTMFKIVLPQAFKTIIPPLVNEYITILKLTSLASVIAVYEIVHTANTIISNTYRPLEIYTAIAVIYIILVIPLTYLSKRIEAKMRRKRKTYGRFLDGLSP